jgi:hypothetical protein
MKNKLTSSEVLSKMKKFVGIAAKQNGIQPNEVSKLQFLDVCDEDITEWSVRKYGGFSAFMKAYCPMSDKDLSSIQESKEYSSYINKLEKRVGSKELFEETRRKSVEKNLTPLPKIATKKYKATKRNALKRELVLMLNDTHYGLIVDSEEVGDVNKFGWREACRRTALVIKETLEYKPHARDQVSKVNLLLNGDLISGVIHNLSGKTQDLAVHQVNGAVHILTYAIAELAKEFKEVQVTGICGNHEDFPHKREGGRAIQEKYDSFANLIFYSLSVAFRNNKNVKFNFPKTPYAFLDLPGGRTLLAHGDTVFSKSLGNPGRQINVESISKEIKKFNAGEILKGRSPVKLLLLGHVHTFAHFITDDGVEVYIAPSLSGTDGYAHSLTINTNSTGQVIFESTEQFIMGDARLIRVTQADSDKELDDIIPTFTKQLKFE